MKKFFVMEKEGDLPEGKARQWAHETPDTKGLPEHAAKKGAGPVGLQSDHHPAKVSHPEHVAAFSQDRATSDHQSKSYGPCGRA